MHNILCPLAQVLERIDAGCLFNAAPSSIKGQLPDPIVNSLRLYWVSAKSMTVFSLAYLRHIGQTSLQYRIPFDVGLGQPQSFHVWLPAPPILCPPIQPRPQAF